MPSSGENGLQGSLYRQTRREVAPKGTTATWEAQALSHVAEVGGDCPGTTGYTGYRLGDPLLALLAHGQRRTDSGDHLASRIPYRRGNAPHTVNRLLELQYVPEPADLGQALPE